MEPTTWKPTTGPDPIPVDFNWMPDRDAVGLNTRMTEEALSQRGIELSEGMLLNVWDGDADEEGKRDDLIATGHVGRWQDMWILRLQWLRSQSGASTDNRL